LFPIEARGQGMTIGFSQVRTDVTKESIAELMKELRDIRGKRPPTDEELKQAKDALTLSLPGQYETMNGIADKIGEIVLYGLADDFYNKYPQTVRSQTTKSLVDLAQTWVQPDNLAFVVVGDRSKIEDGIKSLNIGPIEYLDVDGRPTTQSAGR
jgi:zinc protease